MKTRAKSTVTEIRADVPTLAFSLRDLAVLAEVIRAYLAYANVKARRSGTRSAHLTILQRLYERFSSISPQVQEAAFPLTVEELKALDQAVEGFLWLLEQMALPVEERQAMTQNLNRFRQELARMLC